MKLTGPACIEALNGAEEAGRQERAEGNVGGVRVERRVRPARKVEIDFHDACSRSAFQPGKAVDHTR